MKINNSNKVFPKKIGQYSYVERLKGMAEKSQYSFAIYKNGNSTAICKLWTSGNGNTQNRQWLVNEINSYLTIDAIIELSGIDHLEVDVPALIDYHIEDKKTYILLEKVSGTLASELPAEKAVAIYKKALEFFDKINDNLTDNYFNMKTRSNLKIVVLFYVYALIALIKNLNHGVAILRAMFTFLLSIPQLLTHNKFSFVHRDLGGFNNILVNKKTIHIIDFQISVLTHPLVEVANIISTKWSDQKFIKAFSTDKLFKNILISEEKNILKAFLQYGAIFDLATGIGKKSEESVSQLQFVSTL